MIPPQAGAAARRGQSENTCPTVILYTSYIIYLHKWDSPYVVHSSVHNENIQTNQLEIEMSYFDCIALIIILVLCLSIIILV